MFSIFNRNSDTADTFSFLGADIHSHLIPGIDDGSRNMKESMLLIEGLQRLGFSKLITTPHIMQDYYPNTAATINTGLNQVQKSLTLEKSPLELTAAAEYYGDEHLLSLLDSDAPLLKIAKDYVLFEVSMIAESPLIMEIIFKMKTKGYQPILAHPERYLYYRKNKSIFQDLDCTLQVNLLSLAGYYGSEQKKLGIQLIESGAVEFLGSDIHHQNQLEFLDKLARDKKVMKLLRRTKFINKELL